MASKYFVQKDGKVIGPMSSSDLRDMAQAGNIMPSDMIWKEGSSTKIRADQVKGLSFPPLPPPMQAMDKFTAQPLPPPVPPSPPKEI